MSKRRANRTTSHDKTVQIDSYIQTEIQHQRNDLNKCKRQTTHDKTVKINSYIKTDIQHHRNE